MDTSIRAIEEVALRAWPALTTRHYDGWGLRFANGYTRRSNSVTPLYGSTFDVGQKIDYCEALYGEAKQSPCFRLTDLAYPADLGTVLSQRGYTCMSSTSVQILDLAQANPALDPNIRVQTRLTREWLLESMRLGQTSEKHLATVRQMFAICHLPMCFLSVRRDGQAVAVGLGVQEGAYIGLFRIAADPRYRRQGLGTTISEGILHLGKANGVKVAYLQVEADNLPALALYQKLGFHEIYQYRYWRKSAA